MSNDTIEDHTNDSRQCMLTTMDNPFNPFTHWDEWLRYDRDQGYYTNEYLARVVETSELLSEEQNASALRRAMDYIVEYNPTNIYMIVFEPKEDKKG